MASLKHLVSFFAFFSLINLLVAQEVNYEQKCWHQFWWWLRWVPAEGWSDGGRICPRFLNSKFSLSHNLNFHKSCSQLNFQMKANILRLPVLNKMGNCIVCLFIWNWFSESDNVSIIFFLSRFTWMLFCLPGRDTSNPTKGEKEEASQLCWSRRRETRPGFNKWGGLIIMGTCFFLSPKY